MSVIIVSTDREGQLYAAAHTGTVVGFCHPDSWTFWFDPAVDRAPDDLARVLTGPLGALAQTVTAHCGLEEPPPVVARRLADAAVSAPQHRTPPAEVVTHLGSAARLAAACHRGPIPFAAEPIRPLNDRDRTPRHELLCRLGDGFAPELRYQMIQNAERVGAIGGLDGAAIGQATDLQRQIADRGLPPTILHVNVSATDPGARLSFLRQIISNEGIDPRNICLELTETAPIGFEAVKQFVQEAHELGCPVFADDFGDGPGSPPLADLSQSGLDGIKLSRLFVEASKSPAMRQLVAALVVVAHDAGMLCVAEQVKTEDMRTLAVDLGFDMAQGFHIGRAVPAEQVVQTKLQGESGL